MWYTLKAAAASLPLVTRLVFFINVTMYLLEKWWPTAYDIACLSPYRTILYFQLHRLVCYSLLHRDIIHLTVNLVALGMIAPAIECSLGSVRFGYTLLCMSVGIGLIYTSATGLAALFFGVDDAFWNHCATGFSGVLLAILVLWVYNFNNSPALFTIRGWQVPPTILPLVLLVATEILPSSSFWCHFCGLALGYLYVAGLLERLQLSLTAVRAIEAWPLVRQTTKWSGFLNSPESKYLPVLSARSGSVSSLDVLKLIDSGAAATSHSATASGNSSAPLPPSTSSGAGHTASEAYPFSPPLSHGSLPGGRSGSFSSNAD